MGIQILLKKLFGSNELYNNRGKAIVESKKIQLAVPAAGEGACREMEIFPGTTVRSMKQHCPKLKGHSVFKDWDSLPFKEDVDLFEKVNNGSQLYVASYQDVGQHTAFKPVRRTYRLPSGRIFIPLWQKQGWKVNVENPEIYIGEYKFYDKTIKHEYLWDGDVRLGRYKTSVYICEPPKKLENHKHWSCFTFKGNGWFDIHFINPITGLDDAILNVQRLIAEAFWFS